MYSYRFYITKLHVYENIKINIVAVCSLYNLTTEATRKMQVDKEVGDKNFISDKTHRGDINFVISETITKCTNNKGGEIPDGGMAISRRGSKIKFFQ